MNNKDLFSEESYIVLYIKVFEYKIKLTNKT